MEVWLNLRINYIQNRFDALLHIVFENFRFQINSRGKKCAWKAFRNKDLNTTVVL
jgi:hypothetical protein